MFRLSKYRLDIFRKIVCYSRQIKGLMWLSFGMSVLVLVLNLINPFFYRMFVVDVVLDKNISTIYFVLAGYLSIFVARTSILFMKNYINNKIVNRLTYKIRLKMLRNYLKQGFSTYDHKKIGDMKMRLDDDVQAIGIFPDKQTIEYLISILSIVVLTILLFLIEWRLALISVLSIPITLLLDSWISNKEKKMRELNRENSQAQSTWLHASLKGWKEIKALNLKRYEKRKLVGFIHKYAIFFSKYNILATTRILVLPKLKDDFFMQFITYFVGGLLIIDNQMTIGPLLVYVQYFTMLSLAVKTLSTANADLSVNSVSLDRVLEELKSPVENIKRMKSLNERIEMIEFDQVSFKYPESDKQVIENFNLNIKKGEKVALVGKSGCGKSTLVKLLAGMIQPENGTVKLSGKNVRYLKEKDVFKRVGFVMQHNILFNTTIRENLLLGNEDATETQIIDATKKANIYNDIACFEKGLDTVIGENGIKLSGGQKQRIVLARLFLRSVDVLVFDEATSALDQENEEAIYEIIRKSCDEKIVIVVAHRQSSIDLCERVIKVG